MTSTVNATNTKRVVSMAGGGSIVLKGNQLVWLPSSSSTSLKPVQQQQQQGRSITIRTANSLVQVLRSSSASSAALPVLSTSRVHLNHPQSVNNRVHRFGSSSQSPTVKLQFIGSTDGVKGQHNMGQNVAASIGPRFSYTYNSANDVNDFCGLTIDQLSRANEKVVGAEPTAFPRHVTSMGPSRIVLRGHGGSTPAATCDPADALDADDVTTSDFFEKSIIDEGPTTSSQLDDVAGPAVAPSAVVLPSTQYKIVFSAKDNASNEQIHMRTLQPVQTNYVSQARSADQAVIAIGNWSSGYTESSSTYDNAPNGTLQPSQDQASQHSLPYVYFSANDAYLEDDAGGLTVGANSSQAMTLTELPSLNVKKNAFLKGLRKPCNCTRSMCLKLYCECFANGEFCKNCNCTNCKNVMTSENDRSRAIKSCLERNPFAFQPKIGKGRADTDRLHNKGCNCKRSSCLKNYCECYEAKVACTPKCKCVSCRNTESDRNQPKTRKQCLTLAPLAGLGPPTDSIASGMYNLPSLPSKTDYKRSLSDPFLVNSAGRPGSPPPNFDDSTFDPKKTPWYYMNDDILQATALCLVAQAEQVEGQLIEQRVPDSGNDVRRAVLKEFGACLQQIIQLSS